MERFKEVFKQTLYKRKADVILNGNRRTMIHERLTKLKSNIIWKTVKADSMNFKVFINDAVVYKQFTAIK